MKKIKLLLALFLSMTFGINAQQIYKEYRQLPTEQKSKEVAHLLAQAGNVASIDSVVSTLRNEMAAQKDYATYAFITNEYAIYLYYRGQIRAYDQLLENSESLISQLDEGHFERLLFEHFKTLMLRIKGENVKAAEALTHIRKITEKNDYPDFLKNCYTDLCAVQLGNSDYDKAFVAAKQVLRLSQPIEESNNHLDIAALYTNIGYALLNTDIPLSNSYLKKAVDLFENTTKHHGQLSYRIMAMGALGRSYNLMKDYEKSLETHQRRLTLALDSLATGKLPLHSLAETYMDFFYTYFESKQYPEMIKSARQFMNLCNSNNDKIKTQEYNASLRLLGYAYTMNGKADSALAFLNESLELEKQLHGNAYAPPSLETYLYIADTQFNRKKYEQAEKAYLKAIRCALEQDSVLTKDNLHQIYRYSTYNVTQALFHLQEVCYEANVADNNAEQLYKVLKYNALNEELLIHNHQLSQNESSGLAFSRQLKQNNFYAIQAAERLANKHHITCYADSAFLLSEKTKLFHLRNNKAITATIKNIPDSILGNYYNLQHQLNNASKELSSAERFEISNALFLSKLKLNHYFQDIDVREKKQLSLNNCPEGQCYISYTLYDSTLYIAAFNHQASRIKRIEAPTLKENINLLIRKIKTGADYSSEQAQLSEVLIAPINDILAKQKHITIIPDSYLFKLPFETLISGQHLLIEDYNVNYQYAYSKVNAQSNTAYTLLAISPFAKEEGALSEDLAALVRSNQDQENLRGDQLVQLPYSGKEIKDISKIFKHQGLVSKTLYGSSANKENILQALPQNSILHFATHGTSSGKKDETGLFLSPDNASEISSSFLSLRELYQFELSGNLVVLSACKSGMGDFKEGEGILSLPRGFIYAGIPNIVASLWKVHDKKTKDLMVAFYKHLIDDKLSYSEALQRAKCDCIKKGYQAMDWAGFILISN